MDKKKLIIIGAGALVVIILIIIIISFMIPKNNNNNNNNNNQQTAKNVTLVYWGLWEPEGVMQSLIAKYQTQNPGVKIQYAQKSFTQYEVNSFTRVKQNTVSADPAPDILRINNTWLPKFEPYLSPVPSNVMSRQEFQSTYYPTQLEDFTGSDGNLYGIPLEVDGLALYYNKSLFAAAGIKEPPKDWDEMIEISKKLTKTDSTGKITQAGLAMGTAKNIKHSADIFNLLLLQNGVDPLTEDGKVVLTNERAESALTFYTDFVNTHKVWSPDLRSDLEMFYSGKLAMMFGPSWRSFDIINSAPSIEFGVAPVPQLPGNDPVNYSMYWSEVVPKNSPNSVEAWKFVKFLSQEPQLRELYSASSQVRAFGEPFPRKSMAGDLNGKPYVSAIIEMAPTMKSWKMGEQSFVEESLRTAINSVVESDTEPATALKDAEKRINEKLSVMNQ